MLLGDDSMSEIGFVIDAEKSKPLIDAWMNDVRQSCGVLQHFDEWVRYRLGAKWGHISNFTKDPILVVFADDTAAVEFKLRWL